MKAGIDMGLIDVSVHHLYMGIRVQIHGHKVHRFCTMYAVYSSAVVHGL
jgi:hypothetical protein